MLASALVVLGLLGVAAPPGASAQSTAPVTRTAPVTPASPAAGPCTKADALFDGGSISAARRAYGQLGSGAPCATEGLKAIRELDRLCDLGRSDLAAHRKDDALAAFKSALAKDPAARCATAGISGAGPDGFARALRWISAAVPHIPTVLAGLGMLIVAGFVILAGLGIVSLRGKHLRLELLWGLRTLLRPRVTLGAIDDEGVQWGEGTKWKVGASMTAQIKERLQRFREEALSQDSPDGDLDCGSTDEVIADLVSSHTNLKGALDKVGEISESTKIVAALVELLYTVLPIRRLSVSGVLNPPSRSGASVTLSMESDAQLAAATTLARPLENGKTPTCGDYMQLVDQAAVWVQFEVTRALTGREVALDEPESYARVRDGLDRHFERDAVHARAAFEEALSLNSSNWAAAIDLSVTEARLAEDYTRAIEILERAIHDIMLPPRQPRKSPFRRTRGRRRWLADAN